MKRTLSLLWIMLAAIAALAQSPARVTVSDTLFDANNDRLSGTVSVVNRTAFMSPDGFQVAQGPVVNTTVTNGALSVALVPNIGSTPVGTSYQVNYRLTNGVSSTNYTETWVVPQAGSPVNIATVRVATTPAPIPAIALSQVTPLACLLNPSTPIPGWSLITNQWSCTAGGGGGGGGFYQTLESATVALTQRLVANFQAGIACADNPGATPARTDCAIDQAFSPTWSGTHTFNGPMNIAGGLKINGAAAVGKIPIGDGTNFVPGDPLVQGTQAEGATAAANPINVGGYDTAGTPALHGAKVINTAPAGTEYGVVTRPIPSGTQNVSVTNTPTVTANAGTNLNTSALALDATLTGGTQKTKIVDTGGANVATVSAAGAVKVDASATTQPISAISLPLPTGAAADTTVANPQSTAGTTTAPSKIAIVGGKSTDATPQYQPLPLTNAGAAVKVDATATTQPVNVSQVAGASVATSASGVQKVGITGNAGAAVDAAGQNVAAPANEVIVGAQFNTTPTTISTGNVSPLQADANGNLKVNIQSGGGSGGTASSFGAAFPASGTAIGVKSGANMTNLTADGSSNLNVNCAAGCTAAGDQSTGSTPLGSNGAAISVLLTGDNKATFQLQAAGTGIYTVTPQCSFDGGTLYNVNGNFQDPVSGQLSGTATIASAQATTNYPVLCPQGASNAQVKVTAYTSGSANWLARATVNSGPGLAFGTVTTAAPAPANNTVSPISLTTAGALRTDATGTTQPISAVSLPLPTGAALDSSLTTIDTDVKANVTLHAGANLIGKVGVDQTTPGTTNAVAVEDGAGNKLTTNSSTFTAKFAIDANVLGTLGTAFTTPGKIDVKGADGDVFVRQATAANLNAQAVGNVASGVSDAGNPVKMGWVFNTAQPTVTAGQRVDAQATARGAAIVATGVDTFHVTVDSAPSTAVTQGTAANLNAQVVGNVASGASDAGNPIKVGGIFNTTQPTVTTGQRVDDQMTARGGQIVATGADAFHVTVDTAPSTAVTCTAANCPVNVAQFGGTNVATGTGAAGAGVPRVTISNDSSLAANQSVNLNQVAGAVSSAANPLFVGIADGTNGAAAVKAASTAAVAADKALVVSVSPNSPLPTGANVVGKVGIDQTTPGTTNGVQVNAALPAGTNVIGKVTTDQTTHGTTDLVAADVTKFGGTIVATGTGASGAGIPRVTIASDSALASVASITNAVTVQGAAASGAAISGDSNPVAQAGSDYGFGPGVPPGAAPAKRGNLVDIYGRQHVVVDQGPASITLALNTGNRLNQLLPGIALPIAGTFGRAVTSTGDALDVNLKYADPCSGRHFPVSISQTASGVVLKDVSGAVTICSGLIIVSDLENVSLVMGQGVTCGTSTVAVIGGTTAATGPNLAANTGFNIPNIGTLKSAGDVCLLQSGSGTVAGYLSVAVTPY